MTETIIFCGEQCKVIERYELSEEYMKEHELNYKKRIRFLTSDNTEIDCADTF